MVSKVGRCGRQPRRHVVVIANMSAASAVELHKPTTTASSDQKTRERMP